ncbi:MAG: DNA polymerase Y family protein [Acidimicrobiales bacterium]
MNGPVRTLVAWFPDWPVTAAGRSSDEPAAVFRANRVVACSTAARAEGVTRGMRRREAQSRCPALEVLPLDPTGEARAFEPVVAALDGVCPRIEVVRPGLLGFAVRGPARYFGGDDAVAQQVIDAVPGPCLVGVADGPFAATLAAKATWSLPVGVDGKVLVIPPEQSPAFLAGHPVDAIGLPDLANLLRRLGIRALGDLAAIPAPQVLARFGMEGAAAHRLARGLDERPLDARPPPPELVFQSEIDPPAERVDTAAFVGKSLADAFQAALAKQGVACSRLLIEAETEHGERLARLWRHDGALNAAAVAERVRWQLDGWLNGTGGGEERPTAGISMLRLSPEEIHADHGRQEAFWGGTTLADDRAGRVLARVQGLLGPDAVSTPVLVGGRGPAERVLLVPWGDDRAAAVEGRSAAPWPGSVPPPSPALVHDPPAAADVRDGDGGEVLVTGRGMISASPATVAIAGARRSSVTAWAGPWPVDERWWDTSSHRRKARLQVVTDDGTAHLLAVDGGRWWLEATYD